MKCGIADVGSNTIKLSLYHCEGASIELLLSQAETVGLAGYIQGGALSEAGILAACRVLSDFRSLLNHLDIPDLYVFATASLRNITNTGAALDTIRRRTGLAVELLSGEEEASLSFLGVCMGDPAATGLLADIGGGSTELVAYEGGAIRCAHSLPVGSLSLYTQFTEGLFPTAQECHAIRARVACALEESGAAGLTGAHLTGVGGTIRAIAKLCGVSDGSGTLPAARVYALFDALRAGDKAALRRILRAAPERIHTLLPGLVLLTTVLEVCGVKELSVSTRGVREGYLLQRVIRGIPAHTEKVL